MKLIDLNQTLISDFENKDTICIQEYDYNYLCPIGKSYVLAKIKNEEWDSIRFY